MDKQTPFINQPSLSVFSLSFFSFFFNHHQPLLHPAHSSFCSSLHPTQPTNRHSQPQITSSASLTISPNFVPFSPTLFVVNTPNILPLPPLLHIHWTLI